MCPRRLLITAVLVFLSTLTTQLRAQSAPQQPAPAPASASAPSTPPPAPESKMPAKPAAAKKVWTDEDMSSLTGPTYDATPNSKSSRPNSSRPRGYSGSANGDYYRNQINSLKAKIADIDQKIDNYEALVHGAAPGEGEKQSGVRITDSRADIQALVKQRQTLQKQISDIEDQARHAGVEPGQLR